MTKGESTLFSGAWAQLSQALRYSLARQIYLKLYKLSLRLFSNRQRRRHSGPCEEGSVGKKCLLGKREDLGSDSRHPLKSWA